MKKEKITDSAPYDPYPFTTRDVRKLFGLNYQQLRKWIDRNRIKPNVSASKTEKTHRFSKENLYAIGAFLKLVSFGVSRKKASEFIYFFNWNDWSDFSYYSGGFYLIVYEDLANKEKKEFYGEIVILPYHGQLPDLNKFREQKNFGSVFIIDVQKIMKFVDSNLE